MMPFIEEIQTYIASQSSAFAVAPSTSTAVPIWAGDIAISSPATAIGIYESGGASPEYTHAANLVLERPSIQVLSRSTSYVNAKGNADTIYDILSSVTNQNINKTNSTGVTNYVTITPNQSPFEIGTDSLKRQRFSCNFFIQKERS